MVQEGRDAAAVTAADGGADCRGGVELAAGVEGARVRVAQRLVAAAVVVEEPAEVMVVMVGVGTSTQGTRVGLAPKTLITADGSGCATSEAARALARHATTCVRAWPQCLDNWVPGCQP